jgi:hypothetical protein
VPELGVEKRPAAVDGGTWQRPPRELLLRRGGFPVEYAGKTASNSKGRRGWRALQLGHAADGTWARHGGPHWRRRTARTGVAGRPVAGQGEVEVSHMRDEEPVALIGGGPLLRRRAHGLGTASQARPAAGTTTQVTRGARPRVARCPRVVRWPREGAR